MRRTCRALTALTAGVALIVLGAAPGAANTGTVTGGTATLNLTPSSTEDLDGTGCDSTVDVDLDDHEPSSTSTGTATLDLEIPFTSFSAGVFVLTVTAHVGIDHTTTPDTVTLTGSTGGSFIATVVTAYATTGAGSCEIVGTSRCANVDVGFLSGMTGTFTGTVASTPPHDLSGTAHLAATASVSAAGCAAPFSALNGKTLTLSSVTASF